MFITSFKMPKGTFILSFIAAVILSAVLVVSLNKEGSKAVEARNSQSVYDYISSFHIEVDIEALKEDEIRVPAAFNDVYYNYNKIQKEQGFDLEIYKGKTLKRYTYPIINVEDEGSLFAEVMTFDGIIVAADIYSTNIGGSIRPLK